MGATRTERTKGAVAMPDDVFRRQIARPDADIVLDAAHMAQPGATFKVHRDFQLNDQQFQLMRDSRAAIERVSPVSPALRGQQGTARSGLQEQTQLEQSTTSLADLMDNFKTARTQVGELLLSLIIEDMGDEEQVIVIEGDTLNPPRQVMLNMPERDASTGLMYRSNDVQRTKLMVAMEDVPSSSSFRSQQLNSLSEAIKSLPADAQQVMMPFLVDLMDLPRKKQVVEALRAAKQNADPEQMLEEAKRQVNHELETRKLDLKEREVAAVEKVRAADAVQKGVQSSYSAMQAAAQIAQNPLVAPVADTIMQASGYQRPDPMGDDPNFVTPQQLGALQPSAAQAQQMPEGAQVQANTSPSFPPVPQQAEQGMQGIETPDTRDNLPA